MYPVSDGYSSVSGLRLELHAAKQREILNRNIFTFHSWYFSKRTHSLT